MRQCLAAWTSTDNNLPPFINITMVDHGFVEIMVRDKADVCVCITLSGTEFNSLIGELVCRR